MMDKHTQEKLTAYALGELDQSETAEVEAIIANNASAQRRVEEIRAIGDIAEEAFASESLGEARHHQIFAAVGVKLDSANGTPAPTSTMRWKQWGMLAATLAVASALAFYLVPEMRTDQANTAEDVLTANGLVIEDSLPSLHEDTAVVVGAQDIEAGEPMQAVDPDDTPQAFTVADLKNRKVDELMFEGQLELRGQDFDRALRLYEEVLVIDPSNKEATRKLAEATLGAYSNDVEEMSRELTTEARFDRSGVERGQLLLEGADTNGIAPPRPTIPIDKVREQLEAIGYAGGKNADTSEPADPSRQTFEIVDTQTLGVAPADSRTAANNPGNTRSGERFRATSASEVTEQLSAIGVAAAVPAPEEAAPQKPSGGLQNVEVGGEIRIRANYFSQADVAEHARGEKPTASANGAQSQGTDFFAGGGRGGFAGGGGGFGGGAGGQDTTSDFSTIETATLFAPAGKDPSGLDFVEQRTRLAARDVDGDGILTNEELGQLQSLGYLDGANRGRASVPDATFNGSWVFEVPTTFNIIGNDQLARVDRFGLVPPPPPQPQPQSNTEAYDRVVDNPFKRAIDEPLSTFSIDVDTGSYPNVRRFLRNGQLPPKDAVRIEELLNYFNYAYAPPANSDPFAAHVELVECPWNDAHRLMRIGLKGREVEVHTRPAANLVFLLDVSGSMKPANKLPLVRDAMQLLTKQLRPDDRVAIVTYAGNSGLVLASTPGEDQATILSAIQRLQSGGSTNGASGIELAYQVARENFFDGGVNRVILATDGDFNVGVTDRGSLDRLIEDKAKSGVFLTVLGVGEGNLKDATMEQLADKGNGQYAYLDSEREARKVLVEQVGGTLVTIAKDVKIQIDFNPAQVGAYRLIGYENRVLAAQDFDDDTKDAGEIGAGHAVTALYEIVPPGVIDYPNASGTQSRYVARVPAAPQVETQLPDGSTAMELLTVKLRHKQPDGDTSKLLEIPITAEPKPIAEASRDTRFAASVAAFGMALRESPYRGKTDWDLIANLAEDGLGDDPHGYRAEFMELIQTARGLKPAIALQASTTPAADPGEVILLGILPWTGGTYVAEIRQGSKNAKRFGVGEGFESFKVISINPSAQEVVIYSEEHRRNFTLNVSD